MPSFHYARFVTPMIRRRRCLSRFTASAIRLLFSPLLDVACQPSQRRPPRLPPPRQPLFTS